MSIPGSALPLLLTSAAGAPAAGDAKSLRFNSADSAYLNRTPSSAGNRKTWTWSGWVKRSTLGTSQLLFYVRQDSSNIFKVEFTTSDTIFFEGKVAGSNTLLGTTSRVFRDASAWYHITFSLNASSTAFTVYVNGVEETLTSVTGPSNQDYIVNSTAPHYIGGWTTTSNCGLYLADVHFIDGLALAATDFGEFDATTGVWNPIAYTGSYGTNGFKLDFSDNSSASALGTDSSGNGNDWTVNNISVATGASNDSLFDSPTNGTQTDTGAGGEVSGNYPTWNPLFGKRLSLSNGNLKAESTNTYATIASTLAMTSGKWYMEYHYTANSGEFITFGVSQTNRDGAEGDGVTDTAEDFGFKCWSSGFYSQSAGFNIYNYSNSVSSGDIISLAFDADAGKLWVAKNGTWMTNSSGTGDPANGTNPDHSSLNYSGGYFFMAGPYYSGNSSTLEANFGQRAFAYTAPSGYKALCTANFDTPTIEDPSTVMDVALWTGNGTSQTISGLGFSPDLVWNKNRGYPDNHAITDTVRGATKWLLPNGTNSELTYAQSLTAFTSDGFSVGSDDNFNRNSYGFVGWCWDATGVSQTNYDPASTGAPVDYVGNTTSGFSIVKCASPNATETRAHGCGAPPAFIIAKAYNSGSEQWHIYHGALGRTYYGTFTTNAFASSDQWGSQEPDSTYFYVKANTGSGANYSTGMIYYLWAPVEGYSAFGSYTGNGSSSDGPFVYTGFRPKWLMVKVSNQADNWVIVDAERNTYNSAGLRLFPNTSGAESSFYSQYFDLLSNGFKARSNDGGSNASGDTYIWAAFAESPFAYARAR